MPTEEALILQIANSDVEKFAKLLLRPTSQEEDVLRMVLGDERYQRMHGAVLRNNIARTRSTTLVPLDRGNVVVLHGIMGGHLSTVDREGTSEHVWMRLLSLMRGRFLRLALEASGLSEVDRTYDVRPSGIMKRYYGDLLLTLAENWNVRAFWYDWRKDLDIAASELQAQINGWFGSSKPIHLIAHSMGGLVARSFIKRYRDRWDAMWDRGEPLKREAGTFGGRLIMLGTPNHGSYDSVQAIAGIEPTVHKLCLIDFSHKTELMRTLNSFVGTYQMLPAPGKGNHDPLYCAKTYQREDAIQDRLDNAKEHHEQLSDVIDTKRMLYVAGCNQSTADGITDYSNLGAVKSYSYSLGGDGRVPHTLGLLEGVPTFYVEESHGDLPANSMILNAIEELLSTGDTNSLNKAIPASRMISSSEALRDKVQEDLEDEEQELLRLAEKVRSRELVGEVLPYSSDERRIEDLMVRGLLGSRTEGQRRAMPSEIQREPIPLTVELFNGRLENDFPHDVSSDGVPPIDAVAVGHYVGVRPQRAELDLDREISLAMVEDGEILTREGLVLTRFTDRGLIRGDLGEPFLLPDPRWPERMIAIAGMGMPGRFGIPELAVLTRELCWCLGRLGKRHLACVLIGSGARNLRVEDAVAAWFRGIKNALAESSDHVTKGLAAITFCELDPEKFKSIEEEVRKEEQRLKAEKPMVLELTVKNAPPSTEAQRSQSYDLSSTQDGEETPIRINLGLDDRGHYHYGAMTEDASVPEREIVVDSRIILNANDRLAKAPDLYTQFQDGRFLQQFLLPADFRNHLVGSKPVVMLLDRRTARIHWEMLAQPGAGKFDEQRLMEGKEIDNLEEFFLAIGRGFTRQLRTPFSGPPEPPPPPKRILRVLVIADPAPGVAHLPGAEEEGVMVADLFESFNSVYRGRTENVVEVKRLFGPREANRVDVLKELMLHSYDVLHFAGHCTYDCADPANSGWIFDEKGNERLTARELTRIDRIPKFVFSNACESGVMRDKPEARNAELAPGFAESFFVRGVANFVCTAWPISDVAGREFACKLYQGLLGIKPKEGGKGCMAVDSGKGTPKFLPMHLAMKDARLALSGKEYGIRTWGAYQHYGNPYFRFFEPASSPAQRVREGPLKQEVTIISKRAA